MNKLIASTTFLVLALTLHGNGQVAHVLDSGFPGGALDMNLPTASYPGGSPGFFGLEPLPATGILGGPPGLGGMTIDQTTGIVYASDGFIITFDLNPLYLPFSPVIAPPPPPVPAPLLLGGGPITGMGADPLAGILWLTDGVSIGGFTLGPILAPVVPPFFLPILAAAPLTGLDHDSSTGTLWACDAAGAIYNFFPGGAPVGPQPVAFSPPGGPLPIGGICVNEVNGVGAIPPAFCSTQLPGFHVCVTDGMAIYDALTAGSPPIPVPFASGAPVRGLAFSCDFQWLPGGVPFPSTGATPFVGWAKATHSGPGGLNALRMVGAPPATPALLLYDFCPVPGGLLIPASGETLWLSPFSPTFTVVATSTDAAGEITAPVDITPAISGISYCMQWAVVDTLAPLGVALTDAFHFTTGMQ